MDAKDLEKYSSAITLSDMEIFVFPELMYSLVLANIMSPIIWKWRELDCFKKLEGKTSYRRLMRLRQFVMDEFDFNLDLETWGLTHKDVELDRFAPFLSPQEIAQSNALFGYQGDRYYFDVDIRRHFGLDKYDSEIIPYWKTETVEAMDAFRLKPDYGTAAGECVSLAALYAAAAFIVCRIPLDDIYMILTPLHSQNFLDLQDGILTNNRRLVTKTMWFNGTEISNKAQRALRNERVTIVTHSSGYVHCLYDEATIDPDAYAHFTQRLGEYLSTGLAMTEFASFLRSHHDYHQYFQICRDCHGQPQFLPAETLFHYEHSSPYKIGDRTHGKLLDEVHDEDFVRYELPGRVRCDLLDEFLAEHSIDVRDPHGREALRKFLDPTVPDARRFVDKLTEFLHVEPRLPAADKQFVGGEKLDISTEQSREEIIDYLQSQRQDNVTADLAFYAYRDMDRCDWRPFVKAAVERNPVSVRMAEGMSQQQAYDWLQRMGETSIYEGNRLAQPDEVANYTTGDGLEKALTLANIIRQRNPEQQMALRVDKSKVTLEASRVFEFVSAKRHRAKFDLQPDGQLAVTR
jgi:hypothetical protein